MPERVDHSLFIDAMLQPARLHAAKPAELDGIVRYARRAGLLANLAARAARAGVRVEALDDLFEGAAVYAAEHTRRIQWELQQLAPLLAGLEGPVVVLKGAAYLEMGLPSAEGRLVSDLDLLLPQQQLHQAESLMLAHGYSAQKQDDYDQHYYRAWMHELPPMLHVARGTVVDLHHNIAPPVSRLKIDAGQLFERAVPLGADSPFLRLGDEDMVLHLCVHMFQDGELHNALRELFDLDALLRRFAADEGYWTRLLGRARQLGLLRPLYYGVRFTRRLLHTPVPDGLVRYLEIAAPVQPLRLLIEGAMQRAILPEPGERPGLARGLSEQLLFLRAHWLRMPPRMLLRHLWTQYRRRGGLKTGEQAAAHGGGDA